MKQRGLLQRGIVLWVFALFCSLAMTPLIGAATNSDEYLLPPPLDVEMILEESIFRRMSVREFTNETVTDEELSTVLWAACGYQTDGGRTIAGINGTYAGIIYVLKEDAAYTYNPENHSLVFFREGDWRDIVGWQYKAPIQLGLCYDTNKADAKFGGAELGQIGQNIQFMANALELGTVVCGQIPPAIDPLDIPENQEGMIVMPLGHPLLPYNFKNRPLWISLLPRIQTSSLSLSAALDERTEGSSFTGTLTKKEISQMVWSFYGFSPYLDKSDSELNPVKRHRTVPSAHGYYPFHIYAVTENGVYRYQPNLFTNLISVPVDILGFPILTFLVKIKAGDHRQEVAQASSQPAIASAPLIILSILDLDMTRSDGGDDFSGELYQRLWYFETGASAHNVLLEAAAWNLSANIVLPTDASAIRSLLRLNETSVPLLLVPVGE
jgi:nitroreductase